jgi:hypothetical protein
MEVSTLQAFLIVFMLSSLCLTTPLSPLEPPSRDQPLPETIMEKNLHLDLRGYATDYRALITQTLQTNQLLEVRPIFVVFAFDRAAYCFRGDV